MDESILNTIKKMLHIDPDETDFDEDIIVNINSALMALSQIGVGIIGFQIQDASSIWTDFVDYADSLSLIKTYVYLKTKLIFDPPTSSTVIDMYKAQIAEAEYRLQCRVEIEL